MKVFNNTFKSFPYPEWSQAMEIKKFTLISNNIGFGPEPAYYGEVEQRLTMNSNGQVWFTGYGYGEGFGKGTVIREKKLTVDKDAAIEILSLLSQYLKENGQLPLATDIGVWDLIITETSGEKKKFSGSLYEDLIYGNVGLSAQVRKMVFIEDLFVFDGNPNCEELSQ